MDFDAGLQVCRVFSDRFNFFFCFRCCGISDDWGVWFWMHIHMYVGFTVIDLACSCVFGVAGCLSVTVCGFGCRSAGL